MRKHTFWMIIGCTVPLLLIFLLPLLGITGNYAFLIFVLAMFVSHLLVPMHRTGGEHSGHTDQSQNIKPDSHESHQH